MAFEGLSPIGFAGVSQVTATLGPNDPAVGTRTTVGGNEYRFVYNDSTASMPVGYGCVLTSGASGYSVSVSSTTSADLCVGVVKHAAITTAAYGWVLTKGFGTVQMLGSSGSVGAYGLIELGAGGLFAPVSNTTGNKAPPVGQAQAAIVTGASGNAYISVF
jgi:hypothetical protein